MFIMWIFLFLSFSSECSNKVFNHLKHCYINDNAEYLSTKPLCMLNADFLKSKLLDSSTQYDISDKYIEKSKKVGKQLNICPPQLLAIDIFPLREDEVKK